MQCPREVAEIVCEILRIGLLRIRMLDDVERCRLEADHLHNLPSLLADFKPELLDYYRTVERVPFMKHSTSEEVRAFVEMWNALAKHVGLGENAVVRI